MVVSRCIGDGDQVITHYHRTLLISELLRGCNLCDTKECARAVQTYNINSYSVFIPNICQL